MNKGYEYRTAIGTFYIVQYQECYHVFYAGFSIGSCNRPEELAAVLGYGYKFSLLGPGMGEIDTSNLGIPVNLSDWGRSDFLPVNIKGYFKNNYGLKSQDTV